MCPQRGCIADVFEPKDQKQINSGVGHRLPEFSNPVFSHSVKIDPDLPIDTDESSS
jgi:hypothetical protein